MRDFLKDVNYLLTEDEVDTLSKYAEKVPNGGTIVDIGTAAGGSAFVMTLSSGDLVKVFTIDPVANEKFLSKRETLPNPDKLTFLNKTSEDAKDVFSSIKIDLLFIDGIHNYEGVTNDFNWYKADVVIFHDYFLYGNTIGKAIDDLEKAGRIEKIEIIDSLYKGEIRTGMYIAKCKN